MDRVEFKMAAFFVLYSVSVHAWQEPRTTQVLEALRSTPSMTTLGEYEAHQTIGLERESKSLQDSWMTMGRAYVAALRRHGREPWARSECARQNDNPFCSVAIGSINLEADDVPEVLARSSRRGGTTRGTRLPLQSAGQTGSQFSGQFGSQMTRPGGSRLPAAWASGFDVATAIENGRWVELQSLSEVEFYRGLLKLRVPEHGKVNHWAERAEEWLNRTDVRPEFYSALASRLEDFLPSEGIERLVIKSYERCYKSFNEQSLTEEAAKAGFRAALFHLARGRAAEAEALLKPLSGHPKAAAFQSRLKYWRMYIAHLQHATDEEATLQTEMKTEYPLSLHGLMGSQTQIADQFLAKTVQQEPIQYRSRFVPELNKPLLALEILLKLGVSLDAMRPYASRVVDLAAGSETSVKIYVSTLLNRAGEGLEKFRLMSQLFRHDQSAIGADTLELFFPLWHYQAIHLYSKTRKLDPFLILAIMRQESAFNERARSSAGALGLLQMMPQTARRLASVGPRDLLKPDTNIRVGTQFFSQLMTRFSGQPHLALAAYNAGPQKAEEWLKRYGHVENPLLFSDLIPFRETREYVASIMRNYYWYARLYSDDWKNVLKPLGMWNMVQ